jgi:hypothetical protein
MILRKILKKKKVLDNSELSSESEISDLDSCEDVIMKCKYHLNFIITSSHESKSEISLSEDNSELSSTFFFFKIFQKYTIITTNFHT